MWAKVWDQPPALWPQGLNVLAHLFSGVGAGSELEVGLTDVVARCSLRVLVSNDLQ